MIRVIIFDFDGVIVLGTNEGYFTCYHQALDKVGVKLDPKEEKRRIIEWWGKGYKKQLELLLKEHQELLPAAITAYEKCYYSPVFTRNIRLVKGAKQALERLSKKYILAIASGMMRKTMDNLIIKFNISYFKKIVTNEDVQKEQDKKPATFMINKILRDLSLVSHQAVYIGDAKNDVVMAKNAGVTPIVVLTGNLTRLEAEKLKVKYIIPDITDIENMSLINF